MANKYEVPVNGITLIADEYEAVGYGYNIVRIRKSDNNTEDYEKVKESASLEVAYDAEGKKVEPETWLSKNVKNIGKDDEFFIYRSGVHDNDIKLIQQRASPVMKVVRGGGKRRRKSKKKSNKSKKRRKSKRKSKRRKSKRKYKRR